MRKIAAALALAALLVGCSSSGSGGGSTSHATKFVKAERAHATQAAKNMNIVIDDLATIATGGGTQDAVDKAGHDAQVQKDYLKNFYDEVIATAEIGNDEETALAVAIDELKGVCGSITDFTDAPTGARAAAFEDKIGPAIHDWNSAVDALWKSAGAASAPHIKTSI